ncbi:hypothetical protein ACFLVX_00470 [Chloroflexota bacterium]
MVIDTLPTRELIILHPALEIRNNLATVGFRHKVVKNHNIQDETIHFISTDGGIRVETSDDIKLSQGRAIFEDKFLPTNTVDIQGLVQWAGNPQPPDSQWLYKEVKDTFRHYIELPEPAYGLIAAWVMGTYFNRAFPCYPYLAFLGPKETGKSNTLECLQNLFFNAIKTRLSYAALGDTAESLRGTIIIDQAHGLGDELREILVDSYKKGGGKRRIIDLSSKGRKVLEFDCYCPKVFASLEPLPDDLADRTFTINMAPASRVYPSPTASTRSWIQTRTALVELMLTAYKEVAELIEEMSESEGYRFGELWLPIGVILALVRADQEEVAEIHSYCERQFAQVRYELSGWDYELVSSVLHWEDAEISSEDLLTDLQLRIDDDLIPNLVLFTFQNIIIEL